ncbi:MAG TPA: hypothetical protein VE309_06130 [Caulobacteraceae bacterium]|nr:hypothetical protein [Caulobacteraceae bacterium]
MELKSWKAWVVAAVALLLAFYSLGLLYEGFVSDHYSGVFTFPLVDKISAERAYGRLPATTPTAERAAAAQRLIEADPTNPESWTAVAYADWLAHGRLSAKGVEALDHSYAVSFFDRPGAVWRVDFALENWADMTPHIRQDALEEARVALKDPDLGPVMATHLKAIRSPEGRLAGLLLLSMNSKPVS